MFRHFLSLICITTKSECHQRRYTSNNLQIDKIRTQSSLLYILTNNPNIMSLGLEKIPIRKIQQYLTNIAKSYGLDSLLLPLWQLWIELYPMRFKNADWYIYHNTFRVDRQTIRYGNFVCLLLMRYSFYFAIQVYGEFSKCA